MSWTHAELAAIAVADAEIEAGFCMTRREISASRELDEEAKKIDLDNKTAEKLGKKKAYNKKYYAERKEELDRKNAGYRAQNRDAICARLKKWHRENEEYDKAYMKAYRFDKKTELLAKRIAKRTVEKAYKRICEGAE